MAASEDLDASEQSLVEQSSADGHQVAPSSRPPLRQIRVLPTPPPVAEETDATATVEALMASAAPRPRPVPPPVESEPTYSLRPVPLQDSQEARLSEEIDSLYRRTAETVSENRALSDQCQGLLKKARAMVQSQSSSPAEVELLLERVRASLARADRSVVSSRRYGPPLVVYGVAWLVVLLLALVFDRELAGWLGRQIGRADLVSMTGLAPFWMCLVWGGIGAEAGSLYGLYRHVVLRDFDSEHKVGYLVQPVLGVVVGALIYMLTGALFFALGEGQTFAATDVTATNPLALVAALAGFGQRHAYSLLDSAVRRLLGASSRADGSGG